MKKSMLVLLLIMFCLTPLVVISAEETAEEIIVSMRNQDRCIFEGSACMALAYAEYVTVDKQGREKRKENIILVRSLSSPTEERVRLDETSFNGKRLLRNFICDKGADQYIKEENIRRPRRYRQKPESPIQEYQIRSPDLTSATHYVCDYKWKIWERKGNHVVLVGISSSRYVFPKVKITAAKMGSVYIPVRIENFSYGELVYELRFRHELVGDRYRPVRVDFLEAGQLQAFMRVFKWRYVEMLEDLVFNQNRLKQDFPVLKVLFEKSLE